ncbi:hypothetical protein [Haloplanus litoreus]|uniref:Uncharacterized protein n=1 Tax=Haloplanus litoreus TaxID=767515 RepID=A0ABD6A188_9EURY
MTFSCATTTTRWNERTEAGEETEDVDRWTRDEFAGNATSRERC